MAIRELEPPTHFDDDNSLIEFEREVGSSQTSTTTGGWVGPDYNPKMTGQTKIRVYDEMRRSDAAVRTSMRIIKAPLLAAEWYIEHGEHTTTGDMLVEFVKEALMGPNGMSRTFLQVLSEALLMLDYGYYPFFKVFKPAKFRPSSDRARERDVAIWKKWAPRPPINTTGWEFDDHGGVRKLKQNRSPDNFEEVSMNIRDLLIFTFDEEGGNPEGVSLLRSAYPHWYWRQNLYRIDAIQKERHGIGIPDVELPPNATPTDKKYAKKLVENLRTNERAGIVRPFGWNVGFVETHTQQVNALDSAKHHGVMILMNVLSQFLALGTQESGSRAVGGVQEDIFVKSTHYVADLLRTIINKFAIKQLVDLNFNDVDKYPELRARRLGDTSDMRAMSVAIRNYIESGAVTPTPEMELFIRQMHDFPMEGKDNLPTTKERQEAHKPGDTSNRVPKPTE